MEKVRIICDSSVSIREAAGYVIQNYEPPCKMEQRGNSSGFLGSNGIGNYKATKGRVNRSQEEPGQENISREITEACLAQAMEQAGGNKTKAARILGIHRSNDLEVYQKIRDGVTVHGFMRHAQYRKA